MKPVLMTLVFNRPTRDYGKLLKVWRLSAKRHMPEIRQVVLRIEPPEADTGRKDDITYATIAMMDWVIAHDCDCLVADVDMMFTGDMMDVFAKPFDIAVTVRDYSKGSYNSGIWYYRHTEAAREFVQDWKRITQEMGEDEETREHPGYGGLDQASLVRTLKTTQAKILELPCTKYNAEQSSWDNMASDVRAIHIKSKLRQVCLGKKDAENKTIKILAKRWRAYL